MSIESPKLRLGILLDAYEVPAWAYYSLERIIQSGSGEICLVLINRAGQENQAQENSRQHWAYKAYQKLDRRLFGREPDASRPRSVIQLLDGVQTLETQPLRQGSSLVLAPEDVQKVRSEKLDILVKLGFDGLDGDILTAACYGTWALHHADYRVHRGGPTGFWEVAEKWPETGAVLYQVGRDQTASRILYASWFFTYPFSPFANKNYILWAASTFLPRQVTALHRLGARAFERSVEKFNRPFDFYDRAYLAAPTNLPAIKHALRILWRDLVELYRRIFTRSTWFLLFHLGADFDPPMAKFQTLMPPKDRLWADPMVLRRGNSYFVFVEELLFSDGKGHISVIEIDDHGNAKDPVCVLKKPYHMSYPTVFEWEGTLYMLPESSENGTVDLFECVEFPHRWEFCKSLMKDVKAADSTLFFHQGKWWLFTAMAENPNAFPQIELFLYSADSLFSDTWTPHPQNPIVSDVKQSRPAGPIFVHEGRIYRPSQDSSESYGHGINLNEILILTENEYREEKVSVIKPDWDRRLSSTHTFSQAGDMKIVDAFFIRSRF